MTARAQDHSIRAVHEIAIVGSDMLLAALPARPVQVSHALLAAGFSLVVPASWGDELLAEHAVRQVLATDARPRIYCVCPRVRRRLLASGDELLPHLLAMVPPPVATANYLRNAWPAEALRIVYLGECEGADDPAIDERVTPAEMLARLEARGIDPARLPTTFRDVVPPDRRRYWSLPGGCPAPEALAEHAAERQLWPLGRDGYSQDLVEGLLSGKPLLLDLAEALDCACAGRVSVHGVAATREEVTALEPPRAPLPVLDPDIVVDVEYRPRLVLSRGPASTRVVIPVTDAAPSDNSAPAQPVPSAGASSIPIRPNEPVRFIPPHTTTARTTPAVAAVPGRSGESMASAAPPANPPAPRPRSMAVTPPGVAVMASREGRQPPAQHILGIETTTIRGGDTPPPPPPQAHLPNAHVFGLHRVARSRTSVRVSRDRGAAVPRAFAAIRRTPTSSETVAHPRDIAGAAAESPFDDHDRAREGHDLGASLSETPDTETRGELTAPTPVDPVTEMVHETAPSFEPASEPSVPDNLEATDAGAGPPPADPTVAAGPANATDRARATADGDDASSTASANEVVAIDDTANRDDAGAVADPRPAEELPSVDPLADAPFVSTAELDPAWTDVVHVPVQSPPTHPFGGRVRPAKLTPIPPPPPPQPRKLRGLLASLALLLALIALIVAVFGL